MPATDAQIRASQINGSRSKGPASAEGRSISRGNGVKHGMSGRGLVLPEGDLAEVERRLAALHADMRPV